MIEQLFFIFVYVFGAAIAYIYFSENYEIKLKPLVSFLIALTLYAIGFAVNSIFDSNMPINGCTFLLINTIYSKLSFKITTKSGLFHSSILFTIMFCSEIIVEASASYIFHIPIDSYKNSTTALIIIGSICKVLYFVVAKIISTLFSYKKNNATNDIRKNFILFAYPLVIAAMLTVFLYTSSIYKFSNRINIICALLSIASLILCCFIFIINQNFQKQENEIITLQSENQRNKMNRQFYSMLEKKNEDQRILVHDVKHHFGAISSMDNISDIKEYIKNVQPEMVEHKYIGKTKNKMFDLVLDRYDEICSDKAINFIVDIRASNLNFVEDTDLVSILSNLLDNAVEATNEIDNPTIRLSTIRENNFIALSITNTCLKRPKANGDRLITTKSKSESHGYGVRSVERTAQKYDGLCHWEFNEKEHEFHYSIAFNKVISP